MLPLHTLTHTSSFSNFPWESSASESPSSKQSLNPDSGGAWRPVVQQLFILCWLLVVWFKPPNHIKGLTVAPRGHLANTLGLHSSKSLGVCKSGCAFLLRQIICVCMCVNACTHPNICERPAYVCWANAAAAGLCVVCFVDVTGEPCPLQRHEPEDRAGDRPGQRHLRGSTISEPSAEEAPGRQTQWDLEDIPPQVWNMQDCFSALVIDLVFGFILIVRRVF